jgi:hypothetical protein
MAIPWLSDCLILDHNVYFCAGLAPVIRALAALRLSIAQPMLSVHIIVNIGTAIAYIIGSLLVSCATA